MHYKVSICNVRQEQFKDFLTLAEEIYSDDPHWVAPVHSEVKRVLDPAVNPYFDKVEMKIFLCHADGKPVARAILVINRKHWARWNRKCAYFGFFESFDQPEATIELFRILEKESRDNGAESLIGPFNPNHYSELGILTENFDTDPLFFETYNKPYYAALLEKAGFQTCEKFVTMINRNSADTFGTGFKMPAVDLETSSIKIRKFNIWRFGRELEIIREINNDAFSENWHFLPLCEKEYRFSSKFLFFVTKPSLVQIAEYKGIPVGVTQFVLNVNSILKIYRGRIRLIDYPLILLKRSSIKEIIVFSTGIKKKFQNTRIAAVMIEEGIRIFKKYPVIATTWMSENNMAAVGMATYVGMKPYKQFSMFCKKLDIES